MGELYCFEGSHGVGKGAVINYLTLCIERETSLKPVVVRDSEYPEFEVLKNKIRQRELIKKEEIIDATAQVRGEIYDKYIHTLIKSNALIFLDRGYYTSAVWQSDRESDISIIITANLARGIPVPKKTFILHAPLDVVMSRISERQRFDQHQQNRAAIIHDQKKYYVIEAKYPECVAIDTNRSMEDVVADILLHVRI
ncbi:hypothetical protein HY485_04975 [Candidatus Woesearchaeota archaeon]|nr:hypothetical protein [Candidatus Woesearchaeota archaeon]